MLRNISDTVYSDSIWPSQLREALNSGHSVCANSFAPKTVIRPRPARKITVGWRPENVPFWVVSFSRRSSSSTSKPSIFVLKTWMPLFSEAVEPLSCRRPFLMCYEAGTRSIYVDAYFAVQWVASSSWTKAMPYVMPCRHGFNILGPKWHAWGRDDRSDRHLKGKVLKRHAFFLRLATGSAWPAGNMCMACRETSQFDPLK